MEVHLNSIYSMMGKVLSKFVERKTKEVLHIYIIIYIYINHFSRWNTQFFRVLGCVFFLLRFFAFISERVVRHQSPTPKKKSPEPPSFPGVPVAEAKRCHWI